MTACDTADAPCLEDVETTVEGVSSHMALLGCLHINLSSSHAF